MQEKLEDNHFVRVENFQEYLQIMSKNLSKLYVKQESYSEKQLT